MGLPGVEAHAKDDNGKMPFLLAIRQGHTDGNWADGSYFLYDSLMVKSGDEPYSVYGLIAQTIEYPNDLSWVAYHLHPNAVFHDGKAIKASDVVYTFKTLQAKGAPHFRHLYDNVINVTATSDRVVRFTFKEPASRNLLLRLSQLRVLPAHYWQKPENDISQAGLTLPLASGPYKIKQLQAGRQVTYERVKHYWAAELPVNKGRHNFDEIRIDYYRDDRVALEAFKQGAYDLRLDGNPRNWAEAYKGKALSRGEIVQELIPNSTLGFYPSAAPGTELKNFWGSASAASQSGQNLSGISLPVIDQLVAKAIQTRSRKELVEICRALDRVIMWRYAVIPQWYFPYWPVVYRKGLAHPDTPPAYENGLSTWWRTH